MIRKNHYLDINVNKTAKCSIFRKFFNKKNHFQQFCILGDMSTAEKNMPVLRPRVNTYVEADPAEIETRLNDRLAAPDATAVGHISHGFGRIQLRDDQQYWSPELTLRIEAEAGGSRISGLIGPKSEVWTLFIFCYAVLGLGTLILLLIGLSNWSLGQPAGILWGVPVGILLFSTLYFVAYTGQKWSRHQMREILHFCEDAVGTPLQ